LSPIKQKLATVADEAKKLNAAH